MALAPTLWQDAKGEQLKPWVQKRNQVRPNIAKRQEYNMEGTRNELQNMAVEKEGRDWT